MPRDPARRRASVAFYEGSTLLDTETLGTSDTVSFTTSALAVGPNTITAVYSGDPDFVTSSMSADENVNQAGTTTSLAASPSTTVYGQTVTLTATIAVVAPGAGSPTGSVQFFVGLTSLGTASLSGDTATLTTTTLPVGTDSVTAQYLGDPNFTTSTSSAVSVTINPVGLATTTTLASSANPSVFGQAVTLTATVKPSSGSGTPTGTVTFYDGSTSLGTATLANKRATLKTTAIPLGSQTITAVYSGDATFATSTSAVLNQTVNPDSTTTKVSSSARTSVYGETVTFTATVKAAAPGSGTPTGTVEFYDGSTDLGPGTLGATGTATFTTSSLPVGTDPITAVYSGDDDFTTSHSPALSENVRQAATSTALTSSANPSVSGQMITFTALIAAKSPGSGTPTGTVTFYNGATMLGTGIITGGIATFSTSSLSVGIHSIKAVYSGDSDFKASTSTILKQVVENATGSAMDLAAAGLSAVIPAASPVNDAIAALPDDPEAGSLVHDVALNHHSTKDRRWTVDPAD